MNIKSIVLTTALLLSSTWAFAESEHLPEGIRAEVGAIDSERVDEDQLDVEHHEQHGNDVERDREAFGWLAAWHDAALVRRLLGR